MSKSGVVAQVIGPVVDVSFASSNEGLPKILDALYIPRPDGTRLILECQRHLGDNIIRAIAMEATDGLVRGMEVVPMGTPISMPVGEQIRGRLFNVVGQAIDGMTAMDNSLGQRSIHQQPPRFEDLTTNAEST
jgi:F-type H+-transporting ATPase subunit beta